ncbi:glucokinase [Acidipila rosea]|uniref:Glucokinase n=2 Tax=Acidipila rosea TaxID=768535 RepID=A0A4R1LBK1_9BACT|nr:glucokinase [Acidipila rosea]
MRRHCFGEKIPMTPFSIGVDLGGTNLRIAAYSQDLGLLETILLPTRLAAGRNAVVDDMCDAILRLLKTHGAGRELMGIGIGTPGPLELPEGKLHSPPNLPGWDGFELRRRIEGILGQQVTLESDANLAALAECMLGRGRSLGIDSLCMLTLGTGIGNGIILGGRVWHGTTGMAGEAGHMTIWPEGPACGCGSNGCLEMYASATAVNRLAREAIVADAKGIAALADMPGGITARELAKLAESGDQDAKGVFDLAGRALGIGLAGLVNTLNLPLYVVGGGLANAWDLLSPSLFAEVHRRSYVYRLTQPGGAAANGTRIMPAELGADSGLLGACILPFTLADRSPIRSTAVNV